MELSLFGRKRWDSEIGLMRLSGFNVDMPVSHSNTHQCVAFSVPCILTSCRRGRWIIDFDSIFPDSSIPGDPPMYRFSSQKKDGATSPCISLLSGAWLLDSGKTTVVTLTHNCQHDWHYDVGFTPANEKTVPLRKDAPVSIFSIYGLLSELMLFGGCIGKRRLSN